MSKPRLKKVMASLILFLIMAAAMIYLDCHHWQQYFKQQQNEASEPLD